MKSKALFLIILISIFCSCSSFKKIFINEHNVKLTISFTFKNIINGYDLKNKTQVFIDGNLAGESSVLPESQTNTFTITVPKGIHRVRITNIANNGDKWEEHTKANGYAVDCIYEKTMEFKSDQMLRIVFDIDEGTKLE